MGPDAGEDAFRVLMVAVEDCVRCLEQRVEGDQKLTMGDVTTEVPPPPCNRVEPRAGGRHVQQHPPPGLGADHGLDLMISLCIRVIPRDLDRPRWMLVDQGLQPFGDLPAAVTASEQHDRFAGIIGDGPQAIPLVRWPGGGKHDVLAPRVPQGAPSGPPTEGEFGSRVQHRPGVQMIAGGFPRLFGT
jgi:hypothetical protein